MAQWQQYAGKWNLQTQGQAAGAFTWPGAVAPPALYSWGFNNNGQLGQGNTTNTSSPVQVGALADWETLAAGEYWQLAIKTDGTLWSWGRNSYGELGSGTTTRRSSPVQIGALTTWGSVATMTTARFAFGIFAGTT